MKRQKKRSRKQSRTPRGYITKMSLDRAVNRFIKSVKTRKTRFDVDQHQKLVRTIAELVEQVERHSRNGRDVMPFYEKTYNDLDRSLGFSGEFRQRERFISALQGHIKNMILLRKTNPYTEQLLLAFPTTFSLPNNNRR